MFCAELLNLFCKSFAESHQVEVEDLKDDISDEVIDVDMAKIRNFLLKMHGLKSKGEVCNYVFKTQL